MKKSTEPIYRISMAIAMLFISLAEDMKINVFVKMEELREVCKAAGKPILLSSFLSELSQIAVTWWCLDKENEGGRHNGR